MLWLLLLQQNQGNRPGKHPADMTLDLSGIDPTTAIADIEAGGRYARLDRYTGRYERSPVYLVRRGEPLPDGWTGGEDVTARVLYRLEIPAEILKRLVLGSRPLSIPQETILPGSYTPARGALAIGVLVATSLVAAAFGALVFYWLVDVPLLLAPIVGLTVGGIVAGGVSVVALLPSGMLHGGGPFYRRLWLIPLLWFLLALPPAIATTAGRALVEAEMSAAWDAATHAGLSRANDAAGFAAVPDSAVPEMTPPDDWNILRGYSAFENIHPADLPKYDADARGVIVLWDQGVMDLDPATGLLPSSLRADRADNARWVAFVTENVIPDAIRQEGSLYDVGWINVRVVDLQTGRLIAHGSLFPVPEESLFGGFTVGSFARMLFLEDAIEDSYLPEAW